MIALAAWQGMGKLLGEAIALGAEFRIRGNRLDIAHTDGLPAGLVHELHQQEDLALEFLDANRPEQEAQRFFGRLGVHVELVTTPEGVPAALDALDRDAARNGHPIALDTETAPRPGMGPPRPTIRINKNGALGAVQPVLLPMVPDVVSVPTLPPPFRRVNVPVLLCTRLNSAEELLTSALFFNVLVL